MVRALTVLLTVTLLRFYALHAPATDPQAPLDNVEAMGESVIPRDDDLQFAVADEIEIQLPIQNKVTMMVSRSSVAFLQKQEEFERQSALGLLTNDDRKEQYAQAWAFKSLNKWKPEKDTMIERYFLKGSWFKPGRKYFVYQPSGGMSNQRLILEHAVLVARALKRVLVVPPLCPHTSMFWNYNKVEWDRTAEGLAVFERVRMENAVPVLGLSNTILRRFVEFNENKNGISWLRSERSHKKKDRGPRWKTGDLKEMFGEAKEDVIFFAKYTMWRGFNFTVDETLFAKKHVQLSSQFRTIARKASEELFGGKPFLGLHIRFQDKDSKLLKDKLSPPGVFLSRFKKKKALTISNRVYVATPPNRITSPFFEAFRQKSYDLVFSDELTNLTIVDEFLKGFPPNDIQSSILGLIEQLICARSDLFLGTGFSTFSHFIRIQRIFPMLLFDQALLPPEKRADSAFLASATTNEIVNVLRIGIASGNVDSSVNRELEILSRKSTCEESTVSLNPC